MGRYKRVKMKVFIYSKKTSKVLAIIKHVASVTKSPNGENFSIVDNEGNEYDYKIKDVKTTIYIN